jgi:hypothetical protein
MQIEVQSMVEVLDYNKMKKKKKKKMEADKPEHLERWSLAKWLTRMCLQQPSNRVPQT